MYNQIKPTERETERVSLSPLEKIHIKTHASVCASVYVCVCERVCELVIVNIYDDI